MSTLVEELLKESSYLVTRANNVILENRTKRKTKLETQRELESLILKSQEIDRDYDKHIRALSLMGTATDESIANTINNITGVINKALLVLFPKDRRVITIHQKMYRGTYSHFEVVLETGRTGRKRSFEMSGTGLAQVVAFMFILSFIDVCGGRKIVILDEILNGLHPKAKAIIKELMEAVSERFQFLVVEHHVDLGKQYEVVKNGEISVVTKVPDNNHYLKEVLRSAGLYEEVDSPVMEEN